MSKQIGIIGAGTAGLHLGLYLRQHGVGATIITDRAPEAYVGARLPNTVAHHAVTIERERALGVDHWPGDEYGYWYASARGHSGRCSSGSLSIRRSTGLAPGPDVGGLPRMV